MMQFTQHPLSAAFPALSDAEYLVLKDSIADLGVQNAITIFDGQVLDGWNRYRAATELGMECPTRELDSWIDPRAFVLAQNKARRHITVAQLALAAASVYEWRGAGRPSGNSALSAELKQAEAAEQAGVSVRSLRQADTVKRDAVPAVVDAVKAGDIGLAKASAIAKLPAEEQADAIHKPLREITPQRADQQGPEAADTAAAEEPKAVARQSAKAQPTVDPASHGRMKALEEEAVNLREALAAAREEVESMARVLDAGDQLAQALKEAEAARDLARGLQTRINGLMTQLAQAKRDAAHWKKKAKG
ncbi:hypothetical protein [Pulveribacter sp.]|uniref:hypothetical protein n=1 Tax=Pulveribacter sp. TaxID=2678893 RepID=UPI0028AE87FF|nr:hypothetical protein [Pulveribacter sp.]